MYNIKLKILVINTGHYIQLLKSNQFVFILVPFHTTFYKGEFTLREGAQNSRSVCVAML